MTREVIETCTAIIYAAVLGEKIALKEVRVCAFYFPVNPVPATFWVSSDLGHRRSILETSPM